MRTFEYSPSLIGAQKVPGVGLYVLDHRHRYRDILWPHRCLLLDFSEYPPRGAPGDPAQMHKLGNDDVLTCSLATED